MSMFINVSRISIYPFKNIFKNFKLWFQTMFHLLLWINLKKALRDKQTNKKSNGFEHIQCLSDQPATLWEFFSTTDSDFSSTSSSEQMSSDDIVHPDLKPTSVGRSRNLSSVCLCCHKTQMWVLKNLDVQQSLSLLKDCCQRSWGALLWEKGAVD